MNYSASCFTCRIIPAKHRNCHWNDAEHLRKCVPQLANNRSLPRKIPPPKLAPVLKMRKAMIEELEVRHHRAGRRWLSRDESFGPVLSPPPRKRIESSATPLLKSESDCQSEESPCAFRSCFRFASFHKKKPLDVKVFLFHRSCDKCPSQLGPEPLCDFCQHLRLHISSYLFTTSSSISY